MALWVAVVGGDPAGSSAAETLAKASIETYLIERKLDNVKPYRKAIASPIERSDRSLDSIIPKPFNSQCA